MMTHVTKEQMPRRVFLAAAATVLSRTAQSAVPKNNSTMPVRTVVLRPYGFEPSALEAPAGKVLLAVHNRLGAPTAELRLTGAAGPDVRRVVIMKNALKWHDIVEFQPGVYLLTEVNHSRFQCRITVI